METLEALQQQLAKLRAMRADGGKRVRFGDEEVEFQAGRDLAAA